ncbi:hypothetical protein P7C73_g1842, partial [Tremellales sp. Uapishka_1]
MASNNSTGRPFEQLEVENQPRSTRTNRIDRYLAATGVASAVALGGLNLLQSVNNGQLRSVISEQDKQLSQCFGQGRSPASDQSNSFSGSRNSRSEVESSELMKTIGKIIDSGNEDSGTSQDKNGGSSEAGSGLYVK